MAIADSPQPILAPAIRASPGVVMRKEFPSRATRAVVLAHCSPLPFRQIRTPPLPVLLARARVFQPLVFRGLQSGHALAASEKEMELWSHLFPARRPWRSRPVPVRIRTPGQRARSQKNPEKRLDKLYCAPYSVQCTVYVAS